MIVQSSHWWDEIHCYFSELKRCLFFFVKLLWCVHRSVSVFCLFLNRYLILTIKNCLLSHIFSLNLIFSIKVDTIMRKLKKGLMQWWKGFPIAPNSLCVSVSPDSQFTVTLTRCVSGSATPLLVMHTNSSAWCRLISVMSRNSPSYVRPAASQHKNNKGVKCHIQATQ